MPFTMRMQSGHLESAMTASPGGNYVRLRNVPLRRLSGFSTHCGHSKVARFMICRVGRCIMSIRKTAWSAPPLILAAALLRLRLTTRWLPSHPTPKATACEPANGRRDSRVAGCWPPLRSKLQRRRCIGTSTSFLPKSRRRTRQRTAKVIRAHDRAWLVAVADRQWRVTGGRLVARVGPLTLLSSAPHTASFMEATFTPGMSSRIHTHPGPEAWVVLEGEQCLETPEGVIRGSAGDSMMVRGGIPMQLFGGRMSGGL